MFRSQKNWWKKDKWIKKIRGPKIGIEKCKVVEIDKKSCCQRIGVKKLYVGRTSKKEIIFVSRKLEWKLIGKRDGRICMIKNIVHLEKWDKNGLVGKMD